MENVANVPNMKTSEWWWWLCFNTWFKQMFSNKVYFYFSANEARKYDDYQTFWNFENSYLYDLKVKENDAFISGHICHHYYLFIVICALCKCFEQFSYKFGQKSSNISSVSLSTPISVWTHSLLHDYMCFWFYCQYQEVQEFQGARSTAFILNAISGFEWKCSRRKCHTFASMAQNAFQTNCRMYCKVFDVLSSKNIWWNNALIIRLDTESFQIWPFMWKNFKLFDVHLYNSWISPFKPLSQKVD